jgi:tetratricopeptide (TPR) repeat protein
MCRRLQLRPGRLRIPTCLSLLILLWSSPQAHAQTAEDYLTQANQLVAGYEWREALSLLQEATTKYPENNELRLRLAQLLVRVGNPERALEALRPVLALSPSDAEALQCLGEARTALGDRAGAVAALRAAVALKPTDSSLLHRLAQALFFEGNSKEALNVARQGIDLGRPTSETRRFYAFLLNLDGQLAESYRQQRAALADDPHNAKLLFEMSETRRLAERYSDALEYADMAIDADPENPLYHSGQARLYRLLKQAPLAREADARAESLLAAFKTYSESLSLASAGKIDEAVKRLTPVVESHPVFISGRLLLADLETRLGHDERALQLYQEAITQNPAAPEARERSAWIRTRRGDLGAALDLLENSPRALVSQTLTRAYLYMSQGRWADALSQFQRVEMTQPLNHQLLKLMSACLKEMGRTDEALVQLEKARRIAPDDLEIGAMARSIRFDQASAALAKRQWARAIELCEGLAEEDPTRGDYALNLAFAREQAGDLDGAIRDYRRGLSLDAEGAWARKNLAICLARVGRFREATEAWRAVCRAQRSAENLTQLGLCQSELGHYEEAEKAFEEALEKAPGTVELLYNLGTTKIRLNKVEEGWELVRQAGLKGYGPAKELLAKASRPQ